MMSGVSFSERLAHWDLKGKWIGKFKVYWLFIKDIRNREFRLITIPEEENKPVTNLRDAQEVPYEQGMQMLNIFNDYKHVSSLLDEFEEYDKEELRRKEEQISAPSRTRYRGKKRGGRGRGRGKIEEHIIVVQEGEKDLKAIIPVGTAPAEVKAEVEVPVVPVKGSSQSAA